MRDFRKLEVWKLSKKLCATVYQVTSKFPSTEIYGLASQIRRAAVSVNANIAEGSGQGTDVHFKKYLYTAFGSASEVMSLVEISKDLALIDEGDSADIIVQLERIQKMLRGLIEKIGDE
jgi:four helix bundle protein